VGASTIIAAIAKGAWFDAAFAAPARSIVNTLRIDADSFPRWARLSIAAGRAPSPVGKDEQAGRIQRAKALAARYRTELLP
jgi:hypothetical protein